jgi:hypothetical protein
MRLTYQDETANDGRLAEAGYYVCPVRGGRSWAWKPPGLHDWRRNHRTERGAARAALKHLRSVQEQT